jgi:hypothetical protein
MSLTCLLVVGRPCIRATYRRVCKIVKQLVRSTLLLAGAGACDRTLHPAPGTRTAALGWSPEQYRDLNENCCHRVLPRSILDEQGGSSIETCPASGAFVCRVDSRSYA